MTLVLGDVIGKIGGADVHRITVPNYQTIEASKELVTVPVPVGKRAVVSFSCRQGSSTLGFSVSAHPRIYADGWTGDIRFSRDFGNGSFGGSRIVTGPVTFRHERNNNQTAYDVAVTDITVYWWLLDE